MALSEPTLFVEVKNLIMFDKINVQLFHFSIYKNQMQYFCSLQTLCAYIARTLSLFACLFFKNRSKNNFDFDYYGIVLAGSIYSILKV